MALLNPTGILPALGFVIYRQLMAFGGSAQWGELFEHLVPNPELLRSSRSNPMEERVDKDPLNQTIRALADISFLDFSDGLIQLTDGESTGDRTTDRARYTESLASCVMASAQEYLGEWGKEAPGSTDLTRSLGFFLFQDPLKPCFYPGARIHEAIRANSTDLEAQRLEKIGSGDEDGQVLHNEERWYPFIRWATFLGFASVTTPSRLGRSSRATLLTVDPTPAVERAIERIPSDSYAVGDFLDQLSRTLPVLAPYGSLYKDLVTNWKGDLPVVGDDVPPSLTHALLMCENKGLVELGRGSDAPMVARLVVSYQTADRPEIATQVVRVTVR